MLEELAPKLSLQRHPLRLAGCNMGRVVTVIRLGSEKLMIHSTAGFSDSDIAEIRRFGEPAWLVEATYFHDTCSRAGREAFPDIPYLVPAGFKGAKKLGANFLGSPPADWGDELRVIEIRGMPKIREHAFYHIPSKTLLLADLLFNLPPAAGRWTRLFMRATAGIREYLGMSRLFRFMIKDRPAFAESMRTLAAMDFERIVVAHGDPIVEDARATFRRIIGGHGFLLD